MPKLLIDVRLLPDNYWSEWPPKKEAYPQFRITLEPFHNIVFDGDTVLEAAEWCKQDITHFISAAIMNRLAEVQAAMDEEQAGGD